MKRLSMCFPIPRWACRRPAPAAGLRTALLLSAALLLWPVAEARSAVSVTDDTGWTLTLETPARRVVALYGALNELMLSLGLESRLVGRTAADATVPALRHLPAVGTHMRPNPELIVALSPDVVVQMAGRGEAREQTLNLRRAGVPVLLFRMENFEDMFSVLRRLGALTGEQARAQELEARLRRRLDAVRVAVDGAPRASVFYEVRYPNLLGAGKDSIVSDVIARAGGRNVLETEGKVARINEEELIRLDPEVYIMQKGPMNPAPLPLDQRAHYATLRAPRTGRVLQVEEAVFARPGPRAVDAVEQLARWLHPNAFETITQP